MIQYFEWYVIWSVCLYWTVIAVAVHFGAFTESFQEFYIYYINMYAYILTYASTSGLLLCHSTLWNIHWVISRILHQLCTYVYIVTYSSERHTIKHCVNISSSHLIMYKALIWYLSKNMESKLLKQKTQIHDDYLSRVSNIESAFVVWNTLISLGEKDLYYAGAIRTLEATSPTYAIWSKGITPLR